MARTKFLQGAVLLVVSLALFRGEAQAVPGYASRNGLACSACHIAFPKLNSFGRAFKTNGYMITQGDPADMDDISDKLSINKSPSLSGLVKLRPFDRKKDKHSKIRAFHELEAFLTGNAGKKFSYFTEVEAEDEPIEGLQDSNGDTVDDFGAFRVIVPHGILGYHHSQALNLQIAYAPLFWADPYGIISNQQRLTRSGRSALTKGQSSGANLGGDSRQFVSLYGRPGEGGNIFYQLGIADGGADSEGGKQITYFGQLQYDFPMGLTIGGYGWVGNTDYQQDKGFQRFGFDFQYEKESFVINGTYLLSKDDTGGGATESNNSWYIEGLWVRRGENGNAFVPNFRYESVETTDGTKKTDDLTLNLSYYFRENAKAYLEYWTETNVPAGGTKGNRITAQVEIGIR